jgi:hypothetical protein
VQKSNCQLKEEIQKKEDQLIDKEKELISLHEQYNFNQQLQTQFDSKFQQA